MGLENIGRKERIGKLGLYKIQRLLSSKADDYHSQNIAYTMADYFIRYSSDKGLLFRIHKELKSWQNKQFHQ